LSQRWIDLRTFDSKKLEALIKKCLNDFYQRRFEILRKLRLRQVIKRKNPYLFKALGTEQASEIVKRILEAYISSSDETIFGDAYFEQIARNLPNFGVSDAKGVDLIVQEDKVIHAYALKSGPNPFNSSQKERQNTEFLELKSRLMKLRKQFDPVLAYAYGTRNKSSSGKWIYREAAGQEFWKEITNDDDFYLKIIRLMKDEPLKRIDQYKSDWDAVINRFTREFTQDFCFSDGRIDWEKLTQFVSSKNPPQLKKQKATKFINKKLKTKKLRK
jgi:hypothetical protein